MADKLTVWKQALVHLGKEANGFTLSADNEARYQFDIAWTGVVEEAFNEGDWNFAKKTVALVENNSETEALGFSHVFDYPADYQRTVAVSNIPNFDQEFYDYLDQGGYLHANSPALYLKYISDAKQADNQVTTWPTHFWRYVAMKLAYETCDKLTAGASKEESLGNRMKKALRQAKSVDARNEPNKAPRPGSWITSRRGGYGPRSGLGNTIIGGEITFQEGDV